MFYFGKFEVVDMGEVLYVPDNTIILASTIFGIVFGILFKNYTHEQ